MSKFRCVYEQPLVGRTCNRRDSADDSTRTDFESAAEPEDQPGGAEPHARHDDSSTRDPPGRRRRCRVQASADSALWRESPRGAVRTMATAALLWAAACSTTTFTSTWKAPEAESLNPAGHKVAAVFITTDESSRRVAEDTLVRKLEERGAEGVATYTLIPSNELQNMEEVHARLAQAGVEGIVTMRVIDESERVHVVYDTPPTFAPYYWHFSGYWRYGWSAPYVPEVHTDKVLRIETLVYSLKRDALLWAGTSRTVDPENIDKLVSEVADTAARLMQKQGLLAG